MLTCTSGILVLQQQHSPSFSSDGSRHHYYPVERHVHRICTQPKKSSCSQWCTYQNITVKIDTSHKIWERYHHLTYPFQCRSVSRHDTSRMIMTMFPSHKIKAFAITCKREPSKQCGITTNSASTSNFPLSQTPPQHADCLQ